MEIGIIGSGNIGGTLARLFSTAGHCVRISNRRGPESLAQFAAELGTNCVATTSEDAARSSQFTVIATPWVARESLPARESFRDTIVIDAMNPYVGHGQVEDLGHKPSSRIVQEQLLPKSLVKAFNTIFFQHLAENGKPGSPIGSRQVVFVSGDDPVPKSHVLSLVEQIGFASFDLGSLEDSGTIQAPGGLFYNKKLRVDEVRAMRP